jgi:hypothetical protein
MLLRAYPDALTARTDDGNDILSLARNTATRSHPNFALLDEIQSQMSRWQDRQFANVPAGMPIRRDYVLADVTARHRRTIVQAAQGRNAMRANHAATRPRVVAGINRARVTGSRHHQDDPTAESLLMLANRSHHDNDASRVVMAVEPVRVASAGHANGGNDAGDDRPIEVVRV